MARLRPLEDESVVQVPENLRVGGLRVAVVTICAYAAEETVRVLCAANRLLYSKLHGYDIVFLTDASEVEPNHMSDMNVSDGVHKPFFWKVNAVKNVLETGEYDWVLWMDCDAFFMEPTRTIDSIIQKYSWNTTPASQLPAFHGNESPDRASLRQRLHSRPPEVSLIVAVDSTGINNGVWLLRNSQWSHEFLTRWWHSNILQGPGKEHNCSDQSTMQHELLQSRAMDLDDAWDEVEAPIWPLEVRIAAQEDLQSFHEGTAMTAMSRAWEHGDFIKHHPGCHYYLPPCKQLYHEALETFQKKVEILLR